VAEFSPQQILAKIASIYILPAEFLQSVSHKETPVVTKSPQDTILASGIADALKSWVMVFLTLGFVVLYGLALVGKLKPLADASTVSRLEPIIFVIIGYYFGRLPSQQNELSLKSEIARQTQRTDAAQHAKEQALQTREALEERVKNLKLALTFGAPGTSSASSEHSHKANGSVTEDSLRYALSAALKILNS
jgi:hypothetical protein